ncbi:MAG: hypothetical protein Q8O89_02870 [Nanoarchaeota archaeon]|nr:hypothetical protein [Nanoarchaeota archaeon]
MSKILRETNLFQIVEDGVHKLKKIDYFKESMHFLPLERKNKLVLVRMRNKKNQEIIALDVHFYNVDGEDESVSKNYVAWTDGRFICLNFDLISSNAEEPFKKCVNSFMHEVIHIFQINVLGYDLKKSTSWEYWHGESFEKIKNNVNDNLPEPVKTQSHQRTKTYINPAPSTKAKQLFEDFNHYPAEKAKTIKLPIGPNSTLVRLGECEGIEYASDKMIFKTDQRTGKRKERTFIHSFTESGKRPVLYSNEDGTCLILYSKKNPIEVTEAGII